MPLREESPRVPCRKLYAALLLLLGLSTMAGAQTPPGLLVKEAIQNELRDNAARSLHYSWTERKVRGTSTAVERVVETPEGVLSRVTLIDGKPLTPEQQSAEAERTRKMTDPEQMQHKAKERKEDDERTRKMLAAIPDAFDFMQVESKQAENGHTLVRMAFTAHPGYNPPCREAMVFTGMGGEMVVDETARRITRIDGTLFRDVNFGWGILGKLFKGGKFVVEQAEVTPGHWDTTRMILRFEGKALFFKTIHIDDDESSWDYRPVPPMNTAQALEFLNQSGAGAQNALLTP